VIHQTWKTTEITAPFRVDWCESWRELHPKWQYRLWTDDELDAFVADEFGDFLSIYRGYDVPIKRVDAARYLILKRIGGVFVDLDFMCLKPLDELLAGRSLVFGSQHAGDWVDTRDHVCNALMAAVPGHPFWNGIEFDLETNCDLEVVEATGPNFLTRRSGNGPFFLNPKDLPTILPNEVFYPVAWDDRLKYRVRTMSREDLARQFPKSHAVTFWAASWL
jgi:mannosyltransferase OCH1-like enzyme